MKYLKRLLVSAVAWFLAPGLIPLVTLAQTTAPRFGVTNYVITAELFPSEHLLSATARIDFVPRADLTTMSFELNSSLRVEGVKDASGKDCNYRRRALTSPSIS